jgi:diguanylate cyclase (GGDEF)-like protein
LATVVVNSIAVIVGGRGEVQDAIDLSEAPIVALAVLLPPGQALIAFVAATLLTEMPRDRALIKRLFNVAIRAVGGAFLVMTAGLFHSHDDFTAVGVAAVVLGAALYTCVSTVIVAKLIASMQGKRTLTLAGDGLAPRVAVWCVSVTVGLTAARLALHAPFSLVAVFALLGLVGVTSHALSQAQREHVRLKAVLEASSRIQASTSEREQAQALLDAARALAPWRHFMIRDTPPGPDEAGGHVLLAKGHVRWLIARPLPGSDRWTGADDDVLGALTGAAAAAAERAQLRDELVRQARLDPLTNVANRRSFDTELDRVLDDRRNDHVGVLLIDLDNFKGINDTLGHGAGDELLQTVASRLTNAVRADDTVARFGGDEFVIVLPALRQPPDAARIMDEIQRALDTPVTIRGWTVPASASIGVAVSPDDGRNASDLLRAADASMYRAKKDRHAGRGNLLAISRADEPHTAEV